MNIKERINFYEEELLNDLEKLVAVPSVRDLSTRKENAPFGIEIRNAFDVFMEIAGKCGFSTKDEDGYACYAQYGEQNDYVGVLGHLDVVEAGDINEWDTYPYKMTRKGDMLYGRGVNDDKGPLLAALYALRIVKDMNVDLNYAIRIIAGGAEETTWECMDHYFACNAQPVMGFSPDGNFPIVNGEKGIMQFHAGFSAEKTADKNIIKKIECKERINFVCYSLKLVIDAVDKEMITKMVQRADHIEFVEDQVTIEYSGKRSLSRNPQRGENALWKLVADLKDFEFAQKGMNQLLNYFDQYYTDDFYGEKAQIFHEDEEMGMTSICPMSIVEEEGQYKLMLDYRYVNGVDKAAVCEKLAEQMQAYQGEFAIDKEKPMLFVKGDSPLIKGLQAAYREVMNEEAELFTKGGASYARTLKVGVAFGATFEGEDPKPHMPNEQMPVSSLLKACEIYIHALLQLAAK